MEYIDHKFLLLVSSHLKLFKQKTRTVYNFRCPYCNDSRLSQTKARGYIYVKEGKYLYKCHNCSTPKSTLGALIEHLDPSLYKEYRLEKFKTSGHSTKEVYKKKELKFTKEYPYLSSPISTLKKISQLPSDHYAKVYVESRKIPPEYQHKLYFAPKFKNFVNFLLPDKFEMLEYDHARLIIPLLDKEKNLLGIQGRAFKEIIPKYMTILMDENNQKIYGLDTVDMSKHVNVLEGPINSMFVDNSIAMVGSDFNSLIESYPGTKFTFIYDNDPRNKEIVSKIEKVINLGYNVFIYPPNFHSEDMNDYVVDGGSIERLNEIIKVNTFSGLLAKLRFVEWKRC